MKAFKNRVEKLESAIGRNDKPLLIISLRPRESREEAFARFHEQHPNVQGLIIILDKVLP